MKILIINTSDKSGGAAIACYRIFCGLKELKGVDVKMLVKNKNSDDIAVLNEEKITQNFFYRIKSILDWILSRSLKTENKILHSPAFFSSLDFKKIKEFNPDVIHLHWICGGLVSIKDFKKLAKLNRPIVWTLHDMWAFCGAEHYVKNTRRYIRGYNKKNRPSFEKGFDLNKWTWKRKKRNWKSLDLKAVSPSKWLAKCAKRSYLFKSKRIRVIPNGIDTNIFKPIDKRLAREILNLPQNKKLVLFGAMDATKDPRKGFNFAREAMQNIFQKKENKEIELVIFGSSKPEKEIDFGFGINYLGKISDETNLALIYSAVDVFVISSLEDNLPNTVMESLSCGNPCVGFNIGGISDMIDHKKSGYLAKRKNSNDLAHGIEWVLNNNNYEELCRNARKKVVENFDVKVIAKKYKKLYKEVLDEC
jgi:glycosyltransferase involved in cell wall biosynthesis